MKKRAKMSRFQIKMKKISKNMAKYLVISDFCRTFALAFET
jgi:hypothetical protein